MNGADTLASCPRWLDRHTPASVLVFRALQVGDMLCAVPALRALRHRLPDAHIALVGLPWAHQFARRYAALIDEFIPFPGHPALPEHTASPHAFPEFLQAVRRRRFDLALQLHGDGCVSNALLAQFDALWQAGFDANGGGGESFLRYPDVGHEIHRLLALTTHLGAPSRGDGLHFPLLNDDARELAAVPLKAPRPGAPYVCLHPGARDPARRWPVARFAALGDAFAAQGMQVVLTGSDDERALTTQVAHAMRAPAINAAAPISLGAMARLMAGAALLVCNDTGVSHVACGLGLPSVVIFRASDMARWAPLDRARHRALWDADGEREGAVLYEALDLLLTTSANSASA
jgi:hypothetical protein